MPVSAGTATLRWLNAAVALFAAVVVYLQVYHEQVLRALRQEDGVLEGATAIFYFAASGLFIYVCSRERFRNVWCWGYALLFFVVAAEEVSWGQRLFGFGTPEMMQRVNVQDEFNLHNLAGIHDKSRMLGLIVLFVMCVLLPATYYVIPRLRALYQRLRLPVYPLGAVSVYFIATAFMAYPRLVLGRIIQNLDEVGEFLLAVGLLAFALVEYNRARRASP